jgi:hypothetical protein
VRGGVQVGPLGTAATDWPILTCPAWLWLRIWWNEDWQGKLEYSEITRPAPLFPPQIPLDQTRDRSQIAAVRNQRLTAWAMARPLHMIAFKLFVISFVAFSYYNLKHLMNSIYFSTLLSLEKSPRQSRYSASLFTTLAATCYSNYHQQIPVGFPWRLQDVSACFSWPFSDMFC